MTLGCSLLVELQIVKDRRYPKVLPEGLSVKRPAQTVGPEQDLSAVFTEIACVSGSGHRGCDMSIRTYCVLT